MSRLHAWLMAWVARACLAMFMVGVPPAHAVPCPDWPLWTTFREAYVTRDARVLDPALPERPSVSEGQAYAMFFALVAGDRHQFDQLLHWTRNNLAGGDLLQRLPGWKWGRSASGQWQLLDANPASDADLWLAYSLLEAGRLWQNEAYTRWGQHIANRLLRESTAVLPGLGRSLLPAPAGFQLGPHQWRLNPSYAPLPLLRRLAAATGEREWLDMVEPGLRLLEETAPRGVSPDWAIWDANQGWLPDPQSGGIGSYNAVRSYLWVGMAPDDPDFERLALGFLPWLHWVSRHGHAPEALAAWEYAPPGTGSPRAGPPGFDAAAMLLADSLRFRSLSRRLRARLESSLALRSPGYYSHALSLFGLGWIEGRYRFAADGALILPSGVCAHRAR